MARTTRTTTPTRTARTATPTTTTTNGTDTNVTTTNDTAPATDAATTADTAPTTVDDITRAMGYIVTGPHDDDTARMIADTYARADRDGMARIRRALAAHRDVALGRVATDPANVAAHAAVAAWCHTTADALAPASRTTTRDHAADAVATMVAAVAIIAAADDMHAIIRAVADRYPTDARDTVVRAMTDAVDADGFADTVRAFAHTDTTTGRVRDIIGRAIITRGPAVNDVPAIIADAVASAAPTTRALTSRDVVRHHAATGGTVSDGAVRAAFERNDVPNGWAVRTAPLRIVRNA